MWMGKLLKNMPKSFPDEKIMSPKKRRSDGRLWIAETETRVKARQDPRLRYALQDRDKILMWQCVVRENMS